MCLLAFSARKIIWGAPTVQLCFAIQYWWLTIAPSMPPKWISQSEGDQTLKFFLLQFESLLLQNLER